MDSSSEQSRGDRFRLVVSYDGAGFHGFARQRGLRTVQGVLEDVLERMLHTPVEVHGSGRTDAGVHARAQVVHFDVPYGPSADRWVFVLRNRLPSDVIPVRADPVGDDFHARFSVQRKWYRYTIYRSKVPTIFRYRYSWHVPDALSLEAMKRAANDLLGTHDFTSFCAATTPVEDKTRTLYRLDVMDRGDTITIDVVGNGFLQYMVRILVGTLVEVGLGERDATSMPSILAAKDRRLAGSTAPAHGLCLWNVQYPDHYGGFVLDPHVDL